MKSKSLFEVNKSSLVNIGKREHKSWKKFEILDS